MSSVFVKNHVNKAIALAASRLGHAQLRPKQKMMREFVHSSDIFVSLIPTGSGKSLCLRAQLSELKLERCYLRSIDSWAFNF